MKLFLNKDGQTEASKKRARWLGYLAPLLMVVSGTTALGAEQSPKTAMHVLNEKTLIRSVPWILSAIEGERTVRMRIGLASCKGGPRPKIDRVEQRWRDDSVVLTVYAKFPTAQASNGVCAGVRLRIIKRLKLSRAIADRVLFDGSSSPPTRRSRT